MFLIHFEQKSKKTLRTWEYQIQLTKSMVYTICFKRYLIAFKLTWKLTNGGKSRQADFRWGPAQVNACPTATLRSPARPTQHLSASTPCGPGSPATPRCHAPTSKSQGPGPFLPQGLAQPFPLALKVLSPMLCHAASRGHVPAPPGLSWEHLVLSPPGVPPQPTTKEVFLQLA